MQIRIFQVLAIIVWMMILPQLVSAQQERKYIRSGNSYYQEALLDSGKIDSLTMQQAEAKYRKALDKKNDSFAAGMNLGNALFKQEKYADAVGQYQLLTNRTSNKAELGQLYYNLGNAYFAKGNLEQSREAYKNSLRANPADTAAKYNLAVVQKLLNDPNRQQSKDNKQDQNQDQQDKQDQQNKQDQQDKQDQQSQQEKQDQQAQQQQGKEGEKGDKEGQAMKEQQISKEDAERILQLLQNNEQKVLQKLQDQKSNQKRKKIDKDW